MKLLTIISFLGLSGCAQRMANWAVGLERWRSNLEEKTIQVGEFNVRYLEGGQGPSVLLVHGFGGDKEHWTRFARKLTDNYHVIALDLPGFGESSRIQGLAYGAMEQAVRLEAFRKAAALGKVHVVGNSMGGMIAAVFVRQYPEQALSLTLIDSAGIRSPKPSDLYKELKEGRNPLLVQKREDMDRLFNFTFVNPPSIPSSVIDQLYAKSKEHYAWNQQIFAEISATPSIVEEALPFIKAPLLVIWGDKDRVIHVSCTKVIQKLKPEAEVKIISDCGHAPMIEKAEETSAIYREFLSRRFSQVL